CLPAAARLFPYRALFRARAAGRRAPDGSAGDGRDRGGDVDDRARLAQQGLDHLGLELRVTGIAPDDGLGAAALEGELEGDVAGADRKSTRLNSSHVSISY